MTMQPLKAHVKNGRLLLDEPTDLPEGHVVELIPRPALTAHPDDEADVRAGLEEAERGEGVRLTPEQLEKWANTGELSCLESSSSRRAT